MSLWCKVNPEHTLINDELTSQIRPRDLSPADAPSALFFRAFLLFQLFSLQAASLIGQATPTASTPGSLLVGGGYVRANPDYSPATFTGWSVFADADLWKNAGLEAKFNHITGPAKDSISETTYEAGLRARVAVGPIVPYLNFTGGFGSFTYSKSPQNGSYGILAGGGGVDLLLTRKILLRGEYNYQKWGSFPPRGLQPNLVTLGLAYRLR